jgi:hypothetical protein
MCLLLVPTDLVFGECGCCEQVASQLMSSVEFIMGWKNANPRSGCVMTSEQREQLIFSYATHFARGTFEIIYLRQCSQTYIPVARCTPAELTTENFGAIFFYRWPFFFWPRVLLSTLDLQHRHAPIAPTRKLYTHSLTHTHHNRSYN